MEKLLSILLPDLRGGGVERVRLILAGEFARRGYAVDLVVLQARGELLAEIPEHVRLVDLAIPRFREALIDLTQYLRRRRPSALLAAMWPHSGLATIALRASRVASRLVVSEHNTLSSNPSVRGLSGFVNRRLGRLIYGMADGVVTVSEGVKRDLVVRTGLSADRVEVIYNPVRPPLASASVDPDILAWWTAGAAAVIAIGSFKPQKDYPNLLAAFAQLDRSRNARLLILGEGKLRAELEGLAAGLGIRDRVLLPGFVPDPYPYLQQADLFVLSSAWEGLGNVIIEALVAGVPVVSTNCPSGPAEILEDGKYGRLIPVGDAPALAAAMADALAASVDRDLLRQRGAEFSVERAVDQYLSLLDPDTNGIVTR